jgi:putative transposase
MARPPRLFLPGYSVHVVQRGNNRGDIFRAPVDREAFLFALGAAAARHLADVHAYVLMTNHVHLILTPRLEDSCARTMQAVGRHYVPYFNRRYQRTGGLFEGRYRLTTIHSEEYWFNCVRYVETNPVRAGLATDPADYKWSSYHVHASGHSDPMVSPHPSFDRLGRVPEERQLAWRTICAVPLPPNEVDRIRTATLSRSAAGSDPNPNVAPARKGSGG